MPFLILFATVLFMIQEPVGRWLVRRSVPSDNTAPVAASFSRFKFAGVAILQCLIALYGGYFGAGIGILMLTSLSLLGLTDIHQMNGLKTLLATCINGVAAGCFVFARIVDWRYARCHDRWRIAGGYAGAIRRTTTRPLAVRRIVISIGVVIAIRMLVKQTTGW